MGDPVSSRDPAGIGGQASGSNGQAVARPREAPSPEAVRKQLDRICSSGLFKRATQASRFLCFTVERTLAGKTGDLKEYSIGLEVFDRPTSYDPRTDPCVRVGAGKLRDKLAVYYRTVGAGDPIIIDLPKGAYVPVFEFRTVRLEPANGEVVPGRGEAPEKAAGLASSGRKPVRRIPWLVGAVAAIAALGVAGGYLLHLDTRRPVQPPTAKSSPQVALRRSVAVIGVENLSGRDDVKWLENALPEMLATEVGVTGELRIVPEQDVERAKAEVLPNDPPALSRDTLAALRQRLAADDVLLGSYTVLPGNSRIRLDLRLQDTATGEIVATRSETGREDHLFDLAVEAGQDLRDSLGLPASQMTPTEERALLPSTLEAARFYTAGLRELDRENDIVARDLMKQVVAMDPNFPLGHLQLGAAWSFMGYDEQAKVEMRRAYELSQHLDRRTRLFVEANYRGASREPEASKAIRRTLYSAFPDDLQYGTELAWDLIKTGSDQEALTVLDQLRRLPQPLSDDPSIDQADAYARASIGDNQRALDACRRGERKAHTLGAFLLEARLRSLEGGILGQMGAEPQSLAATLEARSACQKLGDRRCVMEIERRLGNREIITANPNPKEAVKHYDAALSVAREIHNVDEINFDLIGMATAEWTEGEIPQARRSFEELLASVSKSDPGGGFLSNVEVNFGGMLTSDGDVTPAVKMLREAAAIDRERGEGGALAGALQNLAEAERRTGDLDAAKRDYEESIKLYRQVEAFSVPDAEVGLSDVLWDRGDLDGAQATLGKAEADARAVAAKWPGRTDTDATVSECHVRLAKIALSRGDVRSPEAPTRQAMAALADKHPDESLEAALVLAEDLAAQARHQEALAVLAQAQHPVKKAPYRYDRLEQVIATAAVKASATSGHRQNGSADWTPELSQVIGEAHRLGLGGVELRGKLALAETEIASGRGASGREHLADVRKEAGSRGFQLIASKAVWP